MTRTYNKNKLYRCPLCKALYTAEFMSEEIKTMGSCVQCYIMDGYEFEELEPEQALKEAK